MNKEELEKYKIRDYYMIPVEVVDNMFYLFEQQCKNKKEVIDKIVKYINQHWIIDEPVLFKNDLLDILKEVSE